MDGTRMCRFFPAENLKERAFLVDLGIDVAISLFSDRVPLPIGLNDNHVCSQRIPDTTLFFPEDRNVLFT
jgi:hypothetical protein